MKNKLFKVLLITMTIASAAVSTCPALAAETAEQTGAYEEFEGDEIPEEAVEKFNLAASIADIDVTLKPMALLETQVVSGTNYRFLAEQVPNDPEGEVSAVIVTVYADLNGNAEISTIEESDVNLLVPLNAAMDMEETDDFSMHVSFDVEDVDFDQKTVHVKIYEEALYDMVDVHTLAVGDYIELPEGTFTEVVTLEETVDANNNKMFVVNNGTLNLAAYEGGTYNCPTDNDFYEMTQVAEADLTFADDMVFTDCTTEPGSSFTVEPADLQDYLASLDTREGAMPSHYSYWNTTVSVTGGVITELTRVWMP